MYNALSAREPVFDLGSTLDCLFDGASCGTQPEVSFQPLVRIGDDADEYFVEADLPGLKMAEIEVVVEGRELTISGERKARLVDGATYRREETPSGRFARVFTLPESADTAKVSASLEDGVLRIRIPKAETAKARRIDVQTG